MSEELASHERTYIIDTLASAFDITEESDPIELDDPFLGWDSASSIEE